MKPAIAAVPDEAPKPPTTPAPSPAAQRLRAKIADAAIALMATQKPDGATQKGQDRIVVDREPLTRLRELCAALEALEAAEGP